MRKGAPAAAGQSERILVVEDEQIVALDIRLHLEQLGYTVAASHAEAETALEYLQEVRGAPPDLVIMDIHLQGAMDGVSAAEIIREQYDLPVIFMTAYADEETLARAKVTEPFAYIIKPFEERELRTAVELAMYRHRMSRAIRERERLLSQVMEAIHNGIVVTDSAGKIRYTNSHAQNVLPAGLEAGKELESFLPEPLLRELNRTDAGGSTGNCVNWERTDETGRGLTIEVRSHGLPGETSATVWVLTDLTERLARERALRKQEEQLAHSRRMEAVGRLSAGLAHDFNNLVTVILGYARLALEDAETQPHLSGLRENVQGLYDTAHRSADLTRRLLSLSRVSNNSRETFTLETLLADVAPMVQGVLTENIRLQTVNHAANASVNADRRSMQQVLLNLILNARDAMPQGGMIYLTAETVTVDHSLATYNRTLEPGEYVLLSVTDTGEGIDPDNLPHIFEPFFSTKEETRGSGFGLATVYSVIVDSDGAIQVSSTLGRGTRFSLYLPLAETADRFRERGAVETKGLRGSGTVLVVDEENGVRGMLVHALRSNGYNPISARSVGEALLLLGHFDACHTVVSDLSAPYHTTTEIVELYRNAKNDVQIVLLFAGEQIDAGQDATLLKPFEPEQLLKTLRHLSYTGE